MTLYQLTPDITVVLEQIGAIEVKNKDLKVDVQGKEVKVTYPDSVHADTAYAALLAAIAALGPAAGGFAVGDVVYVQYPTEMRKGKAYLLEIEHLPSDKEPYWEFLELSTGVRAVASMNLTLIKVEPTQLPS